MDTSPSLLNRLKNPEDQLAWTRFVQLYTPLILYWARRHGCESNEAADIVQEVLCVLLDVLPGFDYDSDKSFRSWLRTVSLNKIREIRRRRQPVEMPSPQPAIAVASELEEDWEREYQSYLASRALKLMQHQFQPSVWRACWEQVVGGRPAKEVAEELGISIDSAYAARSRVLRRLRQELEGLL